MGKSPGHGAKLTPAALGDLLADAIADPSLRKRLFSSPEAELKQRGFEDSPSAVTLLHRLAKVKIGPATGAKSKHHPIDFAEGEGEG